MKKLSWGPVVGILVGLITFSGVALAQESSGPLDHLVCYAAKDPLPIHTKVDLSAELQPEFSRKGCVLVQPVEFCVPASKLNADPVPSRPDVVGQPLQDDYVCYVTRCPDQGDPASKDVTDQFGERLQRYGSVTRVCVPALKTGIGCGPIPGARCGGACSSADQVCRFNSDNSECECMGPETCGGRPDAAGICGGTCENSEERCLPGAGNECVCQVPPPPECGMIGSICGGTCPDNPTDVCQSEVDTDGNIIGCICVTPPPPPPCGADDVCGGLCSAANQACLIDADGNCTCAPPPPPPCGLTSANTCGGACPEDQRCRPTEDGCACVESPPPPGRCFVDATTGLCGGVCPSPNQECGTTESGECGCIKLPPPPKRCGFVSDAPGQCGGTCPANQVCRLSGNDCGCVKLPPPPHRCGLDRETGQCGGVCPSNQICAAVNSDGDCGCVKLPPPPQRCGLDSSTDQCGGACPGYHTCQLTDNGCQCVPPPCGLNSAGVCGGQCQGDQVCQMISPDLCECGPPPQRCAASAPQCGGQCPSGQTCQGVSDTECRCAPIIPGDLVNRRTEAVSKRSEKSRGRGPKSK